MYANNLSLIIGADILPTPSNYKYFTENDCEKLIGEELLKVPLQVDYRIFNLEGPLTDNSSPILKDGPALKAPNKTGNALTGLKTDTIFLANNHILDHGQVGVIDTISTLKKLNIQHIGIGKTIEERNKAAILIKVT